MPTATRQLTPLALVCALLASVGSASAQGRCGDEDAAGAAVRKSADYALLETSDADPRLQLQGLVDSALRRNRGTAALRLLTQAAEADLKETQASRLPSASLVGTGMHVGSYSGGVQQLKGLEARGAVSISAPLYDFGRIARLTDWRTQMAEVARQGQSSAEEQLALQTVVLALDRGRYVLQAQVYGQYVRRMSCLVDALEIITKADRGRASELVQAQKSLQQAELSYVGTMASLRQTETRLKRFVGDDLPISAPMSAVLVQVPDLAILQQDILNAPDIAQANAQAKAQRSLAESVLAGQKPSVNVTVNGSTSLGANKVTDWAGGLSVNIPILQPGADSALMAAHRRAQSAQLLRDDAIEAKRYRLVEMNDAAIAALDRARRVVDILRNSDRVRASTLQQWQQLGKRSLFDVMGAEGDYYNNRITQVNALFDAQQVVAMMWSMGRGVATPLR